MDDYLSAEEAAAFLGVTLDTFYVYVSRKSIRSQPTPDSRKRRYWRADVEQISRRGGRTAPIAGDIRQETGITLITHDDILYRGQSVLDLAETSSFETVAALLWGVEEASAFTATLPITPVALPAVRAVMTGETLVDQALALFPLLERANPRSLDLSPLGMARTGADLLRWFTALTLDIPAPTAEPIHTVFANAMRLSPAEADLIRRLLVLSADHGMEPATFAVRAVASTGVSPWRAVPSGLSVALGRRSRLGHYASLARLVSEVLSGTSPADPVIRRFQEADELPGFSPAKDAAHEPRARALLHAFDADFAADPDYQRLGQAIAAAFQIGGYRPTFALLSSFAWSKVGFKHTNAPFLMARSGGWIAHAIEQYGVGERERREPHYMGPLPQA